MKFKTKTELLTQLKKDNACKEGYAWACKCSDLNEILDTCDAPWRLWAMIRNYEQFIDKCDLSKLNGNDWSCLLKHQPQFADKCDWNKLSRWDWSCLLIEQPQFADKCDLSKLSGVDWSWLLRYQPQLEKYKLALEDK